MTCPTTAILDGDIIAYRAACWAEVEGFDCLEDRLNDDIHKIWTPKKADSVVVAFSCSRRVNYRRSFWPNYKANRDNTASPDFLGDCKDYLMNNWDHVIEPRLEADDLIGIHTSSETMIGVTIDKDLLSVPGYHWNPNKDKEIRYVSEEEANRFFYKQWMMGDTTDGVPGLWRIGPKRADKLLDSWDPVEWEKQIFRMYDDPKYAPEPSLLPNLLALAMARSVRILRYGDYDFETKTIELWNPKQEVYDPIVGYSDDKE